MLWQQIAPKSQWLMTTEDLLLLTPIMTIASQLESASHLLYFVIRQKQQHYLEQSCLRVEGN